VRLQAAIPRAYLERYYATVDAEDEVLLTFLHDVFSASGVRRDLLDIGSGPTVYQFLSASKNIGRMVATDPFAANLNEIAAWRDYSSDAFNWDPFVNYVARLENDAQSDAASIKARTRAALACDTLGAVTSQDLHSLARHQTFDIVSSYFCFDAVSETEREFAHCVEAACGVLRPDGVLVLSVLKNACRYQVNGDAFPVLVMDERKLTDILCGCGLKVLLLRHTKAPQTGEHEGIILCACARNEMT
jgi:nicotinamide N-methyltransferase